MIIAPFSKIVVDKHEERKFRRRALRRNPKEYAEALWGYVRGDTAYICAFLKCDFKDPTTSSIYIPPEELDAHEDDANDTTIIDKVDGQKMKLELLGTIHTHPDREFAVVSDFDIWDQLDSQESIQGVCAIEIKNKNTKKERCITRIEYWPAVRPLSVERKQEYKKKKAFAAKARGSKKHGRN